MQELIEQLQQQSVLLILGPGVAEADELATACRELARLPFRKVVTVGEEPQQLVMAWQRAGRQVDVLPLTDDAPSMDESRVNWLVLPTDADQSPAWLASTLRVWLAMHSACYLGTGMGPGHNLLGHPSLKRSYWDMSEQVGHNRRSHWAVVPYLAEGYRRLWEQEGIRVVVTDPCEWVHQLWIAWDITPPLLPEDERETASHKGKRPYQYLYNYTEADAARFFGRSAAVRELGELVLVERLVLCFGPSGAGKSSLLQAGLVPALRRQGCLPLYCRPGKDPLRAIRRAVLHHLDRLPAPVSGASWETPPSPVPADGGYERKVSLTEQLSDLAEQTQRTIVVLLDQFEELFPLAGEETTVSLAGELADCLRLSSGTVHILLSLREDYLAYLHRMKPYLAGMFDHRFRLRPLTREEAREAVEEPARLFDLRYERDLVEQLLDDLGHDDEDIEPSDLQIVCDTLYDDLQASGGETFTLARYQELGGMAQILDHHLERVLEREESEQGKDQVQVMRQVLKALVTLQGTKVPLPTAEIARLAEIEHQAAAAMLRRLDYEHRLVRPLVQEGEETRYELAHEVLGPRVLAWIEEPAEREAKAIHDMLRVEMHNWNHFGSLLGPGKLRVVHTQWDNAYLRLEPGQVELLVCAALRHGVEPAAWLARAEEAGVTVGGFLLSVLRTPEAEARHRAAEILGPKRALAELARLMRDTDSAVRARSVATLGELESPRAFRTLKRARHDQEPAVRDAVWAGLASSKPRAAERLRRRDEAAPVLVAGSLVYWLLLIFAWVAWSDRLMPAAWPAWALAGALWLTGWLVLGTLPSFLHPGLLAWSGTAATACLLIARWGWLKGGTVLFLLLLLGGGMRSRPHLALAGLMPYLPLLGLVRATSHNVLWATVGMLLALVLLALAGGRWGRYGADRPASISLLCAGLGAGAGALAAGAKGVGLSAVVLLSAGVSIERRWARLPLAYSGVTIKDVGRVVWDALDEISFEIKPFLAGLIGALCAALLLWAAAGLAPRSAPAWSIWGALSLGAGLGLWWAERGLLRALLLPALGGALGGALAGGLSGAVTGAGLGLGLGLGEWLTARVEAAQETGSTDQEERR